MGVDVVLSLLMLAVVALLAGAYYMWRRTGETKKPLLMVLLAAIAIANVLIWTVPTSDGSSPINQAAEAQAAETQ